MKYPKELYIGDHLYKFKVVRLIEKLIFKKNNIAANINYKDSIIKTLEFENEKENQANLFHELAHGILREMEFNHPKIIKFRNDEKFIEEFGLVLRKTFIDLQKKGVLHEEQG